MSSSLGSVGVDGILIGGDSGCDNVAQRQVGAERVSNSKDEGGSSVSQDDVTDKSVRPNQPRYQSGAAAGQLKRDCGQEVDLLFAETKRADQRDPRTKLMGRHNEKVNNIAPSIRQGTFDENKNKNYELYNN